MGKKFCIGNLRFRPMGLQASKLQNEEDLKVHDLQIPEIVESFIPIVSKNTLMYKQKLHYENLSFSCHRILNFSTARRILIYRTRDLGAGGPLLGKTRHTPRQALAPDTRPPARANTNPGVCKAMYTKNVGMD